jgi:GNAT superfamily N-acetyltransferase
VTSAQRDQPALLTFDVDGGIFRLRPANRTDLPQILRLLADDRLGASREDTSDMAPYERAFEAIDADPAHLLAVGDFLKPGEPAGPVVATFQLSFRAAGESRRRGCSLMQLTTDKSRKDAHRFYERLGFAASHEGMKLTL